MHHYSFVELGFEILDGEWGQKHASPAEAVKQANHEQMQTALLAALLSRVSLLLEYVEEQSKTHSDKELSAIATSKGMLKSFNSHKEQLQNSDLHYHIKHPLLNAGVTTIEQLCSMTEYEVLECRNIGVTKLARLKEWLASKNLSLKTE